MAFQPELIGVMNMDDKILSTSNDISCIIKNGHASQSPFSEAFIKAVERELHGEIVACYVQTGEFNIFRDGKPTKDFVDEVLVTLYARESCLKTLWARDGFDEEIQAIFWNTVQSLGLQWSYQRVYSQEELAYYGFANRSREQWETEKIPKPVFPPQKNFEVKVESFDCLALYHLLSDKVVPLGKYIRETYGCNTKVYVGFLKDSLYVATHHIVFDTQREYEHFLSLARPHAVAADIQEYLQAGDDWGVLKTFPYHPQYRVWDQLSDEEKMCLLREAYG